MNVFWVIYLLILVICFIIFTYLYFAESINPKYKPQDFYIWIGLSIVSIFWPIMILYLIAENFANWAYKKNKSIIEKEKELN